MTGVKLFKDCIGYCGFELSGHATDDCDDLEGKLICSAVSSAAYMAANTILDVVGEDCTVDVKEGYMYLYIQQPSEKSRTVLEGFALHMQGLSEQYGKKLRITTEV